LAVGVFDPRGGLALAEIASRSIAGSHSLVIGYGSNAAQSRLQSAIEDLRTIRLRDLQIVVRPTGAPLPQGDVVVRRENFTFAFSAVGMT
jgi:hypothetical protein